jgi:DNA-binding GntR family transcriptional regulator
MQKRVISPKSDTKSRRETMIAVDANDTLGSVIRRRLADRILNGELSPESKLDEAELAAHFGVSRTPIREALRQLDVAGLVKIRPHRGAVIVPVDKERIGFAFEAAAEMEALAASWAASRATLLEKNELKKLHLNGAEACRQRNAELFANANRHFHDKISELGGNPSLTEAVAALRLKTAPFQKSQFAHFERMEASQAEHERILAAICFEDPESARRTMREHILRASLWIFDDS